MNTTLIRRALRSVLPRAASPLRDLQLQSLGFEPAQLKTLAAELEQVGPALGLSLTVEVSRGEAVLAETDFVRRVSPQVLRAFLDERPLLVVDRPADDEVAASMAARRRLDHLSSQLRALAAGHGPASLAAASTLPPTSGFDGHSDFPHSADGAPELLLDPDRAQLLNTLRRGLVDSAQPPMTAGYGPGAAIRVDFAQGVVTLDELADQYLRVRRELPCLAPNARPGAVAKQRPLDQLVWDVGIAAGGVRLLHSPDPWWHVTLIANPRLDVSRLTALPQHRELARCLAVAPISPDELRRRCRVRSSDLRGFLQACLFLGLVHWMPDARA